MVNARCFLDFAIEGQAIGRVVFELYSDVVPRTVDNFRALCTGSKGISPATGLPLYYKGTALSKVIAGFMVQGGGRCGSIYGTDGSKGTFEDEDLRRNIDEAGLLVMANKGKNTNGSGFFVSLRPCPHLDGKHVVFGKVVKGVEIIEGISKIAVDEQDVPLSLVTITTCGELELRKAAPKPPSPSPSERSLSRSVSRSPSPERKKKRSSRHSTDKKRERKHRPRDENGKRIKSSKSKDVPREPTPVIEAPSAEELLALEVEQQRKAEAEVQEAERRKRQLEELKQRYEAREPGPEGRVTYKGKGQMKAPDARGNGGMRGW